MEDSPRPPTAHGCCCPYASGRVPHTSQYVWPVVLAWLAPLAGKRVLEAGCGNGSFAATLQKSGFLVSAFDGSESGVAIAKGLGLSRAVAASCYDDLFGVFGERFDAAVALEVIEHLYAPRAFLRRMADVLEPGAMLILSTPYHGYLKNLALALSGKLDDHFTVLWDGGHIKFFSRSTITAMLRECGFEVAQIRGAGRFPFLWKSMVILAAKVSRPDE